MSGSEPVAAEVPDEQVARPWHRRRALRIGGAATLFVSASLVGLWLERRSITTAVIDRKLAQAHVQARYRIVDLGFGGQRLIDVVVGDPARPDLTADWLELGTHIGLDGARVTGVRAGGLRLRAAFVRGTLSLGAIDRLLPQSTGGGTFRLPAIDLEVTDGRLHLTVPAGIVDLALTGQGRLDHGFSGRLQAASRQLTAGGCLVRGVGAATMVWTTRAAVHLSGPLMADRLLCPGTTAERVAIDLAASLSAGMAHWQGSATLRTGRLAASSLAVSQARGRITFAGTAATTTGKVALVSGPATLRGIATRSLALNGRYRLGRDPGFAGRARADGISLPATMLAAIRRQGQAAPATPIAPLLARASDAVVVAGRDFDVAADLALTRGGITFSRVDSMARSGAAASFAPDRPVDFAWGTMPAIAGIARLSGGGLPSVTVRLAQARSRGPIHGVATILPYAAGGARLALDPVRFTADGAGGRMATVATLSGPLADGRVEGLRLPLEAAWNGAGVLSLNPDCITLSYDQLALSTLRLRSGSVPLCPSGAALVRVAGGKIDVEGRAPMLRLAGRLGSTPLTLAADDARFSLNSGGITAHDVAVRLGQGESVTRLDVGRLAGAVSAAGLGGRFEQAGGQIGKVPLLISHAGGNWRMKDDALALSGTADVADSAAKARFQPLHADAVQLRLVGGAINASAALAVPGKSVHVADVTIKHDLGSDTGRATLAVPKLAFDDAFQPDDLTPMTYGVIADVRGAISGDARIDWTAQGVTSTGTFRTDGLDLAAAFGPVAGLAGTIRFTDLLALESAPDQVATVASINPGIPVTDGRVVYRTLANSRVHVASGRWPFAGGTLVLQPTMLDLAGARDRRLTFELQAVNAAQFLQQFDFGNLSATGTFDGTLPMIFDATGGRIEGGHLKVRPGGGNIAYVGELTQKDLGIWGNIAFQALRSIDYRDLAITMNGPLAGEMITEVRFAGISQGKGAKSNFLVRRLQKLPFVFNIRIRAPFRGLIDATQSFYDPSRLIERNLPALLQQQNATGLRAEPLAPPISSIQPAASDPMP
ncbi:YdbH domain-containing protein [Sphingomonas endolithica]|uniref:YdbH domain-containing protein n=1 Tax=Sphingomonas endolithica TaxID=2972485 RepID=UPI0021AED7BA|nr:YdbH domain-containing protein [Sphingomonas sp. ZFBP2030]